MSHGERKRLHPLCQRFPIPTRHSSGIPEVIKQEGMSAGRGKLCCLDFCLNQTLKQADGRKILFCRMFTSDLELSNGSVAFFPVLSLPCPPPALYLPWLLFVPDLNLFVQIYQQKANFAEKWPIFCQVHELNLFGVNMRAKGPARKKRCGQGGVGKKRAGCKPPPSLSGFGHYICPTV